jgi:serine/threonine protein kinase
MMTIYDQEGNPISIGTVVGRGGEAVVYRVIGRPAWLAKIYEPAPRPNYAAKLAWMLDHPPANPTHVLNHPSLAWPAGLLYGQGNRLAGYLMPYIQEAVPVLVVFNPRRRVETLAQFDRRYLHRAARNLATAAEALHTSGYVVGDLNESNVLVTPSALVTLIDTDSFQVQESRGGQVVTYACPVAKPEYTPPELQGKSLSSTVRSPEQDAFSLGVLIFQLLMEGNHPFRAQWLGKGDPPPIEERIALGGFPYTSTPGVPVQPPKYAPDLDLLHPEISELVRRCFIDGHRDPSLRPDASAWEWAITEAEKSLVQCPNRHFYSEHLRGCPVCTTPRAKAGGPAWPTSPAHHPAATSQPTGTKAPAGQPTATSGAKPSAAPPVGKPASQQASTAASQTHTSKRTAPRSSAPSSGTPNFGYTSPGARTAKAPKAKATSGGATSSGRPAKQTSSGHPPSGSARPAAGPFSAGKVASGFKQAQQIGKTFQFWQAQQAQVQQTGSGSGLWGSRQAQQAIAAWKTWQFWQAQQVQQPAQAPPQTAQPTQPPPARPATQAQSAPASPGAAQSTNSAAPPAGAGSAQQTQQPGAHTAQPRPAQNVQGQAGQGQQNQPPPSRPAAQPAQSTPSANGAKQAAPPHTQPPRPAAPHASPQTGRPAYARPATAPAQAANSLLNWAGPRLYKSLAIGGGLGALAGALPGALVGVAGGSTGSMASWVLLWSLGGATAGLLRGWQPGYRMSLRVDKAVGWQRVWPACGILAGAALGGFIGLALGWWAIVPVFLGLGLGAWLGRNAGRKLWQAGAKLGWERIWAGVGAFSAALLGWRLAAWLGAGSLSIQLAGSFSAWITSQSASLVLVSLVVGALGGALGGAVAGTLSDLFARLLNLLD